jgi:hypothetical protein
MAGNNGYGKKVDPLDEIRRLAGVLSDLEQSWSAHAAQAAILDAVFVDHKDIVFLECGRKFGKSELIAYILWRWALTRPGAYYYLGPLQTQVKEIIWEPGRLQSIGPSKYIKKIDESELRVHFTNGSFIKVDGSDNYQKYRGINPHGLVLDEFKDFRPEFWPVMDPNRSSFNAQAVFAGTPPEIFSEQWDAISAECQRSEAKAYFHFPTWANPHISRDWLRSKKEELYAREEGVVWEREYGARRIYGGPGAIFPMFDRNVHVVDHDALVATLEKDRAKLQWYLTADPGTTTVFAGLFTAVNPYTKEVFHLDELYLTSTSETSCSVVMPKVKDIRNDLYPGWEEDEEAFWTQTYDEAAAWFGLEAVSSFGESFVPTHKATAKKDAGISLIKDQMIHRKVFISTRCKKLCWEIEQYIKNAAGRVPKEHDHLIDCYRYTNAAAGLSLVDEPEVVKWKDKDRRAFTMEEDLAEARVEKNGYDESQPVKLPSMEYSE